MPYIISSGVTSDGFILESDTLELLDGGVMNQATVYNLGYLNVSSGGMVNSATVNQDGWITVFNGGMADYVTVNDGGHLYISKGGTANNATINSGGWFYLFENSIANSATVSAGTVIVNTIATVNSAILHSGGKMDIYGGWANYATVNQGTSLNLYSGTASSATVNSGGRMDVYNRGTANSATVGVEGTLNVSSGGAAGGILVQDGGRLTVFSGGRITSATVQSGGKVTGDFNFNVISFESGAVLDFGVFCRQEEDQGAIIKNISSVPDGVCYSITVAEDQKEGTYLLADGITGFDHTVSLCNPEIQIGTLTLDDTVKINGNEYTLRLTDGELTLTVEESEKTVTQYVYLDFDGEGGMRYRNSDLKMSIALSVRDSGISEERRQTILSELTEQYAGDGIVFTLERPENEDAEYSTLYFGKSKAFDEYGEFFGVSETHDRNNQDKNDRAFVLLDQSFSDGQIVSVASHMLDHLLGYSYMADGTPDLKQYAESKYLLSTEWNQTDPYNKYVPAKSKKSHYYTGCTNTAAAQIINYWIEKGLLDFSLSLDASDAYEKSGITISADDNPSSGHLSFAETNKLLADYEPGNEDSIAALCFAAGVIQQAAYEQDGTSTSWLKQLFHRSGFEKNC